jgi:hypothetical protein
MADQATTPSNLDLLRIKTVDPAGGRQTVPGLRGFVIACTDEAEEIWIGSEVPADLAAALQTAHRRGQPRAPREQPASLPACERLLQARGWPTRRRAGPSYLIEAAVPFSSGASIESSERPDRSSLERLRRCNPGNWEPLEWDELLDGHLGPWCMAIERDRVISICHTPGPLRAEAAECGVWTDPAFRGRGHAAAVTSAWAAMLLPSGRHLFYCTTADNLSSQRVAERLKLRPLGWTWGVAEEADHAGASVHPLSALRRSAPAPT